MQHTFLMPRIEAVDAIDAMAVMILEYDSDNPERAWDAFVDACSDWVAETQGGAALYRDNNFNLNIGDILLHDVDTDVSFLRALRAQGLRQVSLRPLRGSLVSYDFSLARTDHPGVLALLKAQSVELLRAQPDED